MPRPFMRTLLLALIAAALGVSSAFLVACGDRNSLVPPSDASAMKSDLDQANTLYSQERCRAAEAAVAHAQDRASSLPNAVDSALRTTLAENLQVVFQDIRDQCGKTQTTQSTQTTTTTPTQTTQTTQTTETTTTQTQPPTTTTQPPTTTTQTTTTDSGGTPAGPGGSGGAGGGTP
jgi:cell division protein FtsN